MGTVIKNVKLVLPKGKIIRGTIKWDKGKIVSVSEGEILILWMGQLRPF